MLLGKLKTTLAVVLMLGVVTLICGVLATGRMSGTETRVAKAQEQSKEAKGAEDKPTQLLKQPEKEGGKAAPQQPKEQKAAQTAVTTKEIPEAWRPKDIADAAPPRSDTGPVHVLAWKIVERRPLRLEYCLVLKELKKPTQDQGQWVLASLVHNPAKGKKWDVVTLWFAPDPQGQSPPLSMHMEEYKNRPKTVDIYQFIDRCNWWPLRADEGWKLIGVGVCRAWEKVVGEKPTRTFK